MTKFGRRSTCFIEKDGIKTHFLFPSRRPRREKSLLLQALWSFSHVIFRHISRIISSSCNKIVLISRKNKTTVRIWGFGKRVLIRAFLYILIIYSNMVTRKSDFNIDLLENSSGKKPHLYTIFFDTPCLLDGGLESLTQRLHNLARTIKPDYLKHRFCLNLSNLERNMS
jgi:hypothetical protein